MSSFVLPITYNSSNSMITYPRIPLGFNSYLPYSTYQLISKLGIFLC
ncbi:hypothetical protein IC582_014189 [Cucumis melo]